MGYREPGSKYEERREIKNKRNGAGDINRTITALDWAPDFALGLEPFLIGGLIWIFLFNGKGG